jgi:hypothetical protein
MKLLSAMSILIESPWLALLPMVFFVNISLVLKKPVILFAALPWLAYLPYEYAMRFRILCSGECNIRVDLLLIYPALIVISLVGLILSATGYVRRETP